MPSLTSLVDAFTRQWWVWWGRPVDLAGQQAWLQAPSGDSSLIGDSWMTSHAALLGGRVITGDPEAGLVETLSHVAGPGFDPGALQPEVVDFYQHTASWHLTVSTTWSPWLRPFAFLVERLFGRRVRQLSLPTSTGGAPQRMNSTISVIVDAAGRQQCAGWVRTLDDDHSDPEVVFSGAYAYRTLPGHERPSVHVTFPLERGNLQVFLRPEVDADGSLWLRSPARSAFGDDGCYVVVRVRGRDHAAKLPLDQSFHVFVADGVLRTDHVLTLQTIPAMRMHYVIERSPG